MQVAGGHAAAAACKQASHIDRQPDGINNTVPASIGHRLQLQVAAAEPDGARAHGRVQRPPVGGNLQQQALQQLQKAGRSSGQNISAAPKWHWTRLWIAQV